jgi:tetratricopeptide (TPR) repeat protein
MLVVGLGGGLVVEAVPPSIERIEVVEIEREMIRANRMIADQRRIDPLSDPRVHIIVNDARSALLLTQELFDAIVSQPSHPWTASASHLYTEEFFELAKNHLSEDGVFVQWMGLGFVDEPLLKTLVATLRNVFPYVQVYQPAIGGLLFTGTLRPFEPERTLLQAHLPGENLQLFSELGIYGPADVAAHLVLDAAGARDFSMGAPINTDDRNLLQTRSPAVTRSGMHLDTAAVLRPFDPLAKAELRWKRSQLVRRMLASGLRERAQGLAAATPAPADRHVGLGLVARDSGRIREAIRHFTRALELQPTSVEARAALLEFLHARAGDASRREFLRLSAAATAPQRTVIEGWNFEQEARWVELRGMEARLSAIPANDPSFPPAGRLRCAWRLADGDPELAAEALQILDGIISHTRSLDDLTLRARAAAQAGYLAGALASIAELNRLAGNTNAHRSSLREALDVVLELPHDAETSNFRARLVGVLRARVRGPTTASDRDARNESPARAPRDPAPARR